VACSGVNRIKPESGLEGDTTDFHTPKDVTSTPPAAWNGWTQPYPARLSGPESYLRLVNATLVRAGLRFSSLMGVGIKVVITVVIVVIIVIICILVTRTTVSVPAQTTYSPPTPHHPCSTIPLAAALASYTVFPPLLFVQSPQATTDPTGRMIENHRNPNSKFWFFNFSKSSCCWPSRHTDTAQRGP
jgi:hypothetical protein